MIVFITTSIALTSFALYWAYNNWIKPALDESGWYANEIVRIDNLNEQNGWNIMYPGEYF